MDMQLKDRTALVTGASVGIGRGIALALAAEGVRLAITARRVEKLEALAAEIVAAGGAQPVLIVQDMYAEDAARCLADAAVAGLGHVDILVNNAGGSRSFKDLHVSEAQWQEAITLNFHRPRQVADALIDQMIARNWGRIINITGKSEPEHTNGAFCAKAGLHSWAKGLSRMVGKHGITALVEQPPREAQHNTVGTSEGKRPSGTQKLMQPTVASRTPSRFCRTSTPARSTSTQSSLRTLKRYSLR